MKTTIDAAGRIVVPEVLPEALGLKPGQPMEVRAVDGRLEIEIAWDLGPVTLNATFLPKIERYNDVATVGLWVTLWPGRW